MKTNHRIEEHLNWIIVANIAGPGYRVSFSHKMTNCFGQTLDMPGYEEVTVIGPHPYNDLSYFWRVWDSLFQPEKKDFYRRHLSGVLQGWAEPWREFYLRGINNLYVNFKCPEE